ncbi:MAG: polysaccharide biosynthesis protein, partial [Crocinitomicaceae bacterium]|nr:polysaccharide biosynthesis protein [Crocinitomicaceae bacterium]
GAIAKSLLETTKAEIWILDCDESRLHSTLLGFSEKANIQVSSYLMDIKDPYSVAAALDASRPDMLIHAAALKHVPVLEAQTREGYMTNVIGTSNVLAALKDTEIDNFVFISTDKAAYPANYLGKTKLVGELLTAGIDGTSNVKGNPITTSVVRFGNVFLSRGSVLETFIHQIKTNSAITLTNPDMERFFIDLEEASKIILKLMSSSLSGISILDMGPPVKLVDLINRLQNYFQVSLPVTIIGTKEGEKLHENLLTDFEKSVSTKFDLFENIKFSKVLSLDKIKGSSLPRNDGEAKVLIQELLQ